MKAPRTEVVTNREDPEQSVTVQRADIAIGNMRFRVMREQATALGAKDLNNLAAPEGSDVNRFEIAVFVYPYLVSATVGHTGFEAWPPTLEDFIHIDEEFWDDWAAAVRRLNPHWYQTVASQDVRTADPKE